MIFNSAKRVALLLILLVVAGSFGCKSSSPNTSDKTVVDGGEPKISGDPKKKKKVDFLFFEATTQHIQGNPEEALQQYNQVVQIDPKLDAAWYNMARISLELKNAKDAVRYGKEALALKDDNYWYYAIMADAYQKLGQFDNTIEILQKTTEKFPDKKDSWFNLAQVQIESNKHADALETLDRFEKVEGQKEEIIFRKFQVAILGNDRARARLEIDRLKTEYPFNLMYWKSSCELNQQDGNKEAAMEDVKRVLELDPEDAFGLFSMADYYRTLGNLETSDEYLFKAFKITSVAVERKLEIMAGLYPFANADTDVGKRLKKLAKILLSSHGDDPRVMGAVGDVYLQNDEPDSAAWYYRASLEEDGSNISAWEELLNIDMMQGKFDALVKDAESAMEYFPDHNTFLYYYGIGNSRTGDDDEAIFAFERIKKLSKNQALLSQACTNLGEIFNRTGEHTKADENMDKALEISPDDPVVLNNYAWYLALRKDRLDDAESMVEKALESSPNSTAYLDTYGWVFYQKGDYANAEKWLKKAIDNGGDAEIIEHYGDTLYKLGRKEEAQQRWQEAIDKGAKIKIAKKLQEVQEQ